MTEEEAKKKWCPKVNYHGYGNRPFETHTENKCIASDCMMWRWLRAEDLLANKEVVREHLKHGYCGLGGKP